MIAENLKKIEQQIATAASNAGRLPEDIKLVAVSKRFPLSAIVEAFQAGQLLFGENYVQELQEKRPNAPGQAKFHFIGHLQSNKAKIAAEHCDMVETVDRFKLGKLLNNHSERLDRTLKVLVQVNIGEDTNKSGVAPENAEHLLNKLAELSNIHVCGLMTMPPIEANPEDSRVHFRKLRLLSEKLQAAGLFTDQKTPELSMGMSADFPIAIEEGATIIRVGTSIFGQRRPR